MENKVSEPKIKYTRRGGIYIKPSDILKSTKGRELVENNYKSKLAKSIRDNKKK